LLTDAIFGHLFLAWIYTLWRGMKRSSLNDLALSAIILVMLQGLKPTFFIAGTLIIYVALIAGNIKANWKIISILIGASLVLPVFLTFQIHKDHGVVSPNLQGTLTVRYYLMPRSLARVMGQDFEVLGQQIRSEDQQEAAALAEPASEYGRLYLVQQAHVSDFFRREPMLAFSGMLIQMVRQLAAPQEFVIQLFFGDLPNWGRALGSLMSLTLFGAAFWGAWRIGRYGNWGPFLLLLGVVSFFLVAGSVSTRVGARLRFPADMVAIPLASIAIDFFSKKTRQHIPYDS
jgi:hypothetical protein